MRFAVREPARVRVEADGCLHAAEALELTGHRAAIRSSRALAVEADVRLVLDWEDGAETVLPGVVRATGASTFGHVAHLEVTGIEGDWERFLAFVGPSLVLA